MTAADPAPTPYVAFLVKRFPRLSETFVLNEFLELRRRGVPLRLFAIMDPREPHAQPEASSLRADITYLRGASWWPRLGRVVRAAVRHPRGLASALAWVIPRRRIAAWRRLGEALVLVDELEGDTVHLHVHWAHAPAGVAFLAHRIAGTPWSLTTHAKDLYTTPVADLADRCEQASFVATCTSANAVHLADVIGVDPAKVVMCRHGVRLDRFSSAGRRPEPGNILTVGRLVAKKGFPTLLDACAVLAARGVAFHLDVVGDGPLDAELRTRVEVSGLTTMVEFHAARPQPELVSFYNRAAVFAITPTVQDDGDRDGVPNVVLEAMASGVPVVASAISGIPEVVSHGVSGLLVPPGDPTALADAIERLLKDLRPPSPSEGLRRKPCTVPSIFRVALLPSPTSLPIGSPPSVVL